MTNEVSANTGERLAPRLEELSDRDLATLAAGCPARAFPGCLLSQERNTSRARNASAKESCERRLLFVTAEKSVNVCSVMCRRGVFLPRLKNITRFQRYTSLDEAPPALFHGVLKVTRTF